MKENWMIYNRQADFSGLAKRFNVSPLIIKLMVNRGIDENEMQSFLYGKMDNLANPYLMKDLKTACEILLHAANSSERVAIVTDYDCDGIFSGMILYTVLKRIGANPGLFTPDRTKEGYGINRRIIDEAYNKGFNYIITCDNGIAAAEEIDYAKELGLTVIITDHHEIPFIDLGEEKEYIIPRADAVCNPKQPDCGYPFKELCGAGVAYRLACVLYDTCRIPKNEYEVLIIYAGMATVADIMPLKGENRIIVREGLRLLSKTNNVGLYAMKDANNLIGSEITPYHIGFVLGPCFNAAGRLGKVSTAFELLLTDDKMEAADKAGMLKALNEDRKMMTETGTKSALELALSEEYKENKVLVLYLENCHESIAGIIAGRVKETVYKPTIIFTDAEDKAYLKGSGRSVEAYDMFDQLSKVKSLFVKMGGHKAAAGMTIKREDFAKLSMLLNVNTTLTERELTPVVRIDAEVLLRHISINVCEQLSRLEPYGNANNEPLFAGRHFNIVRAKIIGRNQNVLKMVIADAEGNRADAIYFGDIDGFMQFIENVYGADEKEKMMKGAPNNTDVAFTFNARINEYNGMKSVQLIIKNYM